MLNKLKLKSTSTNNLTNETSETSYFSCSDTNTTLNF